MHSLTSTGRRSSVLASLVVVGLAARTIAAQDTAIILGAGRVGSWSTVGFVGNPGSGEVQVTIEPFSGPCPLVCVPPGAVLPAHSSVSLESLLASDEVATTFATFYLTASPASGSPTGAPVSVPNIGARLVDQTHPSRSVNVPVVLLSQLEAANPTALHFGGVTHGGFGQSNLVLGNIVRAASTNSDDLPVMIDLFDASGALLGTASLTVPYGGIALIGDVAGYISAVPVALGQLRVTRASGNALMWGILYTTDPSGAITATAGMPLSP